MKTRQIGLIPHSIPQGMVSLCIFNLTFISHHNHSSQRLPSDPKVLNCIQHVTHMKCWQAVY